MKHIVHVNQHVIKRNRKRGESRPPLTVKTYKSNMYAHEVCIEGPCKVVYRPNSPLSCGAHVWIETYGGVTPEIWCPACCFPFDQENLGREGCPNCLAEGLEECPTS